MYRISISPEEINELAPASFPGKIKVIESVGLDFFLAVNYLRKQKIIGFDTESRPCFSPDQPHYGVSLLQLSGHDRAFLFRIKLMKGIPKLLRNILSDEKILKIGAAVNDDVRGLEKHHKFEPKSFIDLQKMVWEYGIKDKSVKKMAAIILGIRISKTQQLSNWEAEELSDVQQAYAATDAWVCREMYLKLMASPKNPLTPEQMMPNPPKNAQADKEDASGAQGNSDEKQSKPANRRRRKPRRRKPANPAVEGEVNVASRKENKDAANAGGGRPGAEGDGGPDKKKQVHRRRKPRPRKPKPEGVEGEVTAKTDSAGGKVKKKPQGVRNKRENNDKDILKEG